MELCSKLKGTATAVPPATGCYASIMIGTRTAPLAYIGRTSLATTPSCPTGTHQGDRLLNWMGKERKLATACRHVCILPSPAPRSSRLRQRRQVLLALLPQRSAAQLYHWCCRALLDALQGGCAV